MKPFYTRWLSYEHCVNAICKELPSFLQTLSQLYESSGDAEAYDIIHFWLLLMAYQAVILYQNFSVPCSIKLVHAEEDT